MREKNLTVSGQKFLDWKIHLLILKSLLDEVLCKVDLLCANISASKLWVYLSKSDSFLE